MTKGNLKETSRDSKDILKDEINKFSKIFPQFLKDGEIDFDSLKSYFTKNDILAGDEKYGLGWAGKGNAFKSIRTKATGTLTFQEDESKNPENTENIFIEGDNLEVLKLLQKKYRESVKIIYIDPPYNTGNDFIYSDNFKENASDYYERTGQSENGVKLTSNPESNGRYHSDWLTMMYPRLFLARNLLNEEGVVFVSIDDNEQVQLKLLCDEIFGEENFVANIVVQTNPRGRTLDKYLAKTFEYILVYVKNSEKEALFQIPKSAKALKEYNKKDEDGEYRLLELRNRNPVFNRTNRPNLYFPIYINPISKEVSLEKGDEYTEEALPLNTKKDEGCWTWSTKKVLDEINILVGKKVSTGVWRVYRKDYIPNGGATTKEKTLWLETSVNHENGKEEVGRLFGNSPFDFPKSVDLVKKVLRIGTKRSKNNIVLDFFAGSGTTAQAVMDLNAEDGGNRKCISVQIPELVDEKSEAKKTGFDNIAQISRERIKRAGEKILEDKKEDIAKRKNPLDIGFKAFSLEKSNYRKWNELTESDTEDELKKQMKIILDKPLIYKYKEKNVVYEILLKEGFDLNSVVKKENNNKLEYWKVKDADRNMIVTFVKNITKEQVDKLNLDKEDIFVCLDSALDDTAKVNIVRNLIVKVI